MKNNTSATSRGTRNVLLARVRRFRSLLILLLMLQATARSQNLGLWNFNGNNNGVSGLYNSLMPADFSPAIPGKAYNPTVYYGEDGWPSGGLNTAAYFEFGLAPLVGNILNIANISMTIRRSSTGTPSGSGPTRWTLRSSIDGYTSDLATGALTPAANTFNITPGSSFISLLLGVRFRLYGYQATVSSGGMNRLVMENLQLTGIGFILPVRLVNFSALLRDKSVRIDYAVADNEAGTLYDLERSSDGSSFYRINHYENPSEHFSYSYADDVSALGGQTIYYRLKITAPSGGITYSTIVSLNGPPARDKQLLVFRQGQSLVIRTSATGKRQVSITSISGQPLCQAIRSAPDETIRIDLPVFIPGLYVVMVTFGNSREAKTIFLQ